LRGKGGKKGDARNFERKEGRLKRNGIEDPGGREIEFERGHFLIR